MWPPGEEVRHRYRSHEQPCSCRHHNYRPDLDGLSCLAKLIEKGVDTSIVAQVSQLSANLSRTTAQSVTITFMWDERSQSRHVLAEGQGKAARETRKEERSVSKERRRARAGVTARTSTPMLGTATLGIGLCGVGAGSRLADVIKP